MNLVYQCVALWIIPWIHIIMDEKLVIDKLDGSNWTTWKFQIRHLLLAKGLWGHVDGSAAAPVGEGEDVQKKLNDFNLNV